MTNSRTLHRLILAFIFTLLVSGCISLEKTYPEKQLFRLEPGPLPLASACSTPLGSLIVKQLGIDPGFRTSSFIYRVADLKLKIDYTHEFLIPVQEMITEIVRESLLRTGCFLPPAGSPASRGIFRLSGKILDISGDFRNPGAPLARLELRLLLEGPPERGSAPAPAISRHYLAEVPIPDTSAAAYVRGLNQALRTVLSAVGEDLPGAAGQL